MGFSSAFRLVFLVVRKFPQDPSGHPACGVGVLAQQAFLFWVCTLVPVSGQCQG